MQECSNLDEIGMGVKKEKPVALQPIATDGGWGWMVVFGSFLIHVFADGIVYSFGIMVAELLDVFGESRALTSWVVSLLVGLTLATGLSLSHIFPIINIPSFFRPHRFRYH